MAWKDALLPVLFSPKATSDRVRCSGSEYSNNNGDILSLLFNILLISIHPVAFRYSLSYIPSIHMAYCRWRSTCSSY